MTDRTCMYGQCGQLAVWVGQAASNAPGESYISFACNDHRFGLMYLRPYPLVTRRQRWRRRLAWWRPWFVTSVGKPR